METAKQADEVQAALNDLDTIRQSLLTSMEVSRLQAGLVALSGASTRQHTTFTGRH
jgi:hypothetical protein